MSDGVRLDKWLWQARFAKTRSLAARQIADGLVLFEGRAVKPSQRTRIGDRLSLRLGAADHIIEIRALGQRRGPAAEARLLYQEIATTRCVTDWVPMIEG
jgi:ribosome-associated heat shock protein Hsp15